MCPRPETPLVLGESCLLRAERNMENSQAGGSSSTLSLREEVKEENKNTKEFINESNRPLEAEDEQKSTQAHMFSGQGWGRRNSHKNMHENPCVRVPQSLLRCDRGSVCSKRRTEPQNSTQAPPKWAWGWLASDVGSHWQLRPQASTATSKLLLKNTQLVVQSAKWKAANTFFQTTLLWWLSTPRHRTAPHLQTMSRWPPADFQKWFADEELFPWALEDWTFMSRFVAVGPPPWAVNLST